MRGGVEGRLEFFQKFIRFGSRTLPWVAKASMEASYFCKGVYGYCDEYDGTCGYCWDFTIINIISNREETPPLVLAKLVLHFAILRAWLHGFQFSNHK